MASPTMGVSGTTATSPTRIGSAAAEIFRRILVPPSKAPLSASKADAGND